MQLELFPEYTTSPPSEYPFSFAELYQAWMDCKKKKGRSVSASLFDLDRESLLFSLWQELQTGAYRPGPYTAFIVNHPVKREIFAAAFRDRIVHHLIVNQLEPLLEKEFIYDSFACRPGKGTLFGIHRLECFIARCSTNFSRPCWILKLDIKSFFMSIDRSILYAALAAFVDKKIDPVAAPALKDLIRVIVFTNPAKDCGVHGYPRDWIGLPTEKSLFGAPPDRGLPIGNLTSQVFANFYLNGFDHYLKHDLGLKYYGRYVDDIVIVHQDKDYLVSLVSPIGRFLEERLRLRLHPDKIRLLDYHAGVPFLGAFIKPRRTYVGRRTKANAFLAIQRQNSLTVCRRPKKPELQNFQSVVNSYLGIMACFNTFRLRQAILANVSAP